LKNNRRLFSASWPHCALRELFRHPTIAGEVYFDKSYEATRS